MSDAIATARRVLELAETMRTTDKSLLAYWDAKRERDRIMVSNWPEDVAREYRRLLGLGYSDSLPIVRGTTLRPSTPAAP